MKKKPNYISHGYRQLYNLIKTEDIYSDITKDVKIRFDTSNYKLDRPLPKGKNKKVIGLIKMNELIKNEKIYCIKSKNI